jgi:hypothetical protein
MADSPSRWVSGCRVGRKVGGADGAASASRAFGLVGHGLGAGLDTPDEFVDPFAVSTGRRLGSALRLDRTVPGALRRCETVCVWMASGAFVGS